MTQRKANATYQHKHNQANHTLIGRLLTLPRLLRIVIVLVLALATTLAVFPLVDRVYISYFMARETVIVPSLISAAAGAVMYLAGWRLYVGTVGSTRPATRALWLYLAVGSIALIIDIVLIIQGIMMLDSVAG